MGKTGQQFAALLKKNWIVYKRNVGSTVVSLLVPILFIALVLLASVVILYLMQLAVQENQARNANIKIVRESTYETVGLIPHCVAGPSGSCYTIGYSPNTDPNVVTLIDRMRSENNLLNETIIGFDSEASANLYLSANPNSTQGLFHVILDYGCSPSILGQSLTTPELSEECNSRSFKPLSEVLGVKYAIQYNTSGFAVRGVSVNINTYLLLPMQQAFDRAAFAVFGAIDPASYEVSVTDFTHPEIAPTNIVSSAGQFVIFGALMFGFVVQVGQLVTEKQTKLRESMRVMGLQDWIYWLSWFITNVLTNLITIALLILTGLAFQFDFFLKNDFGTYALLFLLFAISMVPLAFWIASLVDDTDTSTLAGFGIFLLGVFMQSFAGFIFTKDVSVGLHAFFSLFPFVLLAKGLSDLGADTASELSEGLRFADINDADRHFFPLQTVYLLLVMNFALYTILFWYTDNLRYIGRKPWFCCSPSYYCARTKKKKSTKFGVDDNDYEVEMDKIDEDVLAEKKLVQSGDFSDDTPVVIENLQKTYQSYTCGCCPDGKRAFRAVKGIDLIMKQGELFCLLGHNGAGKTTTIGMMTGLFPCSGGDATVFGYSITSDMNEIRKRMGVCPQHDILWKQLTGEEHLELFANLRGISKDNLDLEVEERLKDVDLTSARHQPAGSYSGGMQRRLSVAIALIGNPAIVFLDEPTTGMDPVSRRKVWNLIERVKRGRITLLTTHSMEEADILGDKIAIMKEGRLATIGTSIRLKNRFGTGYGISILGNGPQDVPEIRKFVLGQFRNATTPIVIEDEAAKAALGVFQFEVPRTESKQLPAFFKLLEKNKKKIGVKDFQVTLATLEEVFLQIAHQDDVKEKKKEKEKKSRLGLKIGLSLLAIFVIGVAVALGLVFGLQKSTEPPAEARGYNAEPAAAYAASGSYDATTFLQPPLVSEIGSLTTRSATLTLRTTAAALSVWLAEANGTTWLPATEVLTAMPTTALPNGQNILSVGLFSLKADTAYSVWASPAASTATRSEVTRFRTPFPVGSPRKFRFGVSSGLGKTNRPYRNLGVAAERSLDFFLLLGDTVFASTTESANATESKYTELFQVEGMRNLTKSTSLYTVLGMQELGLVPQSFGPTLAVPTLADKAAQFELAFGCADSATNYRRVTIGDAIDLFLVDMRRDATYTPNKTIISQTQLNWLKNGLSTSKAPFKLIAAHQPISDMSFERTLASNLVASSWGYSKEQRADLLKYIDDKAISGVVFLTGGVEFGLLRVNLTLNTTTDTFNSNALEVVSGPAGSQINPLIRMNAALAQAPQSYRTLVDAWSWTLFEGDSLLGDLTISFINDEGRSLREQKINVFKGDLGIEKSSAAAQFFR